jgi:hypothetical protein
LLSILALPVAHERSGLRPSLAKSLTALGERVGRRGLVVLASDLLDEEPTALAPLSQLAALGHEVIVLQVLHPHEIDFPFRHGLRFQDAEGPDSIEADADRVRAAYRIEIERFLADCQQRCLSAGARYTLARTDQAVEAVIASSLLAGRRGGWG